MILKYILITICCCVHGIVSLSTFFDKGQRAELYELLDSEMSTLKIYMPDDEFTDLKNKAIYNKLNVPFTLNKMPNCLKKYLLEMKKINFIENYQKYNFNEILPELKINEDGYASFDIDQVIAGFDYNPQHYNYNDSLKNVFLKDFLGTNKDFNLKKIIDILEKMELSDIGNNNLFEEKEEIFFNYLDDESSLEEKITSALYDMSIFFLRYLSFLQNVNFNEIFPEYNINEMYPELQIGEDGYAKFSIEEVYNDYDFNPEHYIEIIEIIDTEEDIDNLRNIVIASNKKFNIENVMNNILNLAQSDEYKMSKINEALNRITIPMNLIKIQNEEIFYSSPVDFKTTNATMTFELNGIKNSYKKVTISLSGSNSRRFTKLNYNLKIRGGKDLYGRSHFKLRSDATEPTYLRSKLVSDIHNRLGLKSVSAGYIQLYINDRYMGLYIITDALKPSWIENVYGEKNPTTLYKCENISNLIPNNSFGCVNEDKDITDNSEWVDFLSKINNAKSASDIEDIFEIDHYLYELAIEYLIYGWDHSVHNFYFYRQPNGKWIYLPYDFDYDIGYGTGKIYNLDIETYINEYSEKYQLNNLLILQNPSRFIEILKEVVDKIFNPSTLYSHIDELKQFIKPYVELDKTPDTNGFYPGAINKAADSFYSIEEWDAYSEFTSHYKSYGLKYWILLKYRSVCQKYDFDCDPIYIDENYEYPINENLNNNITEDYSDFDFYYPFSEYPYEYPTDTFYEYPYEYPTETFIENPTEIPNETFIESPTENPNETFIESPTETLNKTLIESPTETLNETLIENPTETLNETLIENPTETLNETLIENPTETPNETLTINSSTNDVNEYYTSSTFIEKETVYDVDEPTFNADDESSFDEEDIIESFISSTSTKTTITRTTTKTRTIIYTTISN